MKIASVLLDDYGKDVLGRAYDKIIVRGDTIIVINEKKFGLFNSSNFSLILDCIWDSISQSSSGIIVLTGEKYGFYSYDGNCILNCVWDKIKLTNEGLIVSKDGKQGFYSFDGVCIFECTYKRVEAYATAILAFKDKQKFVYDIKKGELK